MSTTEKYINFLEESKVYSEPLEMVEELSCSQILDPNSFPNKLPPLEIAGTEEEEVTCNSFSTTEGEIEIENSTQFTSTLIQVSDQVFRLLLPIPKEGEKLIVKITLSEEEGQETNSNSDLGEKEVSLIVDSVMVKI